MSYRIKHAGEKQIVLEKEKERSAFIAFVSMGCLFLFVGIYIAGKNISMGMEPDAASVFPILGGLIGILVGFFVKQENEEKAALIIFDKEKKCVQIQQMISGGSRSFIPYSEIKEINKQVSVTRDSKNRRRTSYLLKLVSKDGDTWLLHESSLESNADEVLIRLTAFTELDMHSGQDQNQSVGGNLMIPKPVLSSKLSLHKEGSTEIVTWKNKGSKGVFLVFLMLLLFGFIGSRLIDMEAVLTLIFFIFFFFFLLLVLAFISSLYEMKKNYDTRYGIAVGKEGLEYFESSVHTGDKRKSILIPFDGIENIAFSKKSTSTTASTLVIHTKKNIQLINELKGSSNFFSALWKSRKRFSSIVYLHFNQLNDLETLEVERWIKQKIEERSGIKVL